jgi:hypothetical protein
MQLSWLLAYRLCKIKSLSLCNYPSSYFLFGFCGILSFFLFFFFWG